MNPDVKHLLSVHRRRVCMFKVEFYETEDGRKPVEEFLDSLDIKSRAKMGAMMLLLAEKGNELREPYTEPLENGIFELRAIQGNNISRALFFFYSGKRIIITNGFVKKQQKTPKKEIELAKIRRKDFYRQEEKKG
ncbi:MAG: type II toxin-antitoxin system RelE/ParE family toxin [Clostridia bacterium]|nr:type II toxin-antitoxin system RelE/ParE family toxin [Clostridia bacterium]